MDKAQSICESVIHSAFFFLPKFSPCMHGLRFRSRRVADWHWADIREVTLLYVVACNESDPRPYPLRSVRRRSRKTWRTSVSHRGQHVADGEYSCTWSCLRSDSLRHCCSLRTASISRAVSANVQARHNGAPEL